MPDDDTIENLPGETVEPTTPATTETSTEAPVQSKVNEDEQGVSHAEPNPAQTLQVKASDFDTILKDNSKDRATRIREVLSAVHSQDSTFLNDSERFAPLSNELASSLGVSTSLVRKCKGEVLKIANKGSSGEPEVPAAPATTSKREGGGAPIGGATTTTAGSTGGVSQTSPSTEDGDEGGQPVKWTPAQVTFLFRFMFRMVNKFLKEWELLTEDEEKDIGKLLPPVFDSMFPATEGQQSNVMLFVALASIFVPRVFKVVDARFMHKNGGAGSNGGITP